MEDKEVLLKRNNLPEGITLVRFLGGTHVHYLAVKPDGTLYSSRLRDEYGKIVVPRPKGGVNKDWESYKLKAINGYSPRR